MLDQLVPESYLAQRDAEIRKLVTRLDKKYAFDGEGSDDCSIAFRRCLLFIERPPVEAIGLGHLSPQAMFCNRYYWFVRGMVLDGQTRGYYSWALQDMFLDLLAEGYDRYHVDISTMKDLADAAGYDQKLSITHLPR